MDIPVGSAAHSCGSGGDLKSFRAGDVHRMTLGGTRLDHATGRVLNLDSEEDTDPIDYAGMKVGQAVQPVRTEPSGSTV